MAGSGQVRPRYEEIAQHLRALVQSLPAGDRLPSEAELCARFGVSRMTARQAVQQLAADQLVERRRGAGTFVSAPRVLRLLGSPLSFTESMRRRGSEASSLLLTHGPIRPDPEERAALGLALGEDAYVLERLRLADGRPMAVERAVIPAAIAARLDDDRGMGSLHAAFERAGHVPTRAIARVSAHRVSARHRHLLELPATGIVLREHRTISDQDGVVLESTDTRYAADRYVFEAVLSRDIEGANP